jgi:hypothetical protein
MVGAKLVLTLLLGIPGNSQRAVDYWLLDNAFGLEVGTPVAMSGRFVGRVAAKKQRGDTTFVTVWYANVHGLPRSPIMWLQRLGFEGVIALEIASGRNGEGTSVARGGRLHVISDSLLDSGSLSPGYRSSEEAPRPFVWQPIPPGSPPRIQALRAT